MIKILAIDDNQDNLISIKAILTDIFSGVVVLTAQNGPQGIELAITCDPDVILLDIVMPGMDGFEVCRRLKNDKKAFHIPVVFLTALKEEKENRIKALELGAEGFLQKPIDEQELTAQVRAMVKIKAANELKKDEEIRLNKLVSERTKALEDELNKRKKAEAALRKTENHYKALIDKAPDGVALINAEGEFLFVSPSAKKMFNYNPEQQLNAGPLELTNPDDLPFVLAELEKLLTDPSYIPTLQYRFASNDGNWKWIESTFCNLLTNPDIQAIIINFRDINDRKEAEELLKESEYFFKETQRAAFVGSYNFDLKTNHWTSSEILDQIFGIDNTYLRTMKGWLDLIHPEEREMMDQYFQSEVVAKRIAFNKEYRIIRLCDGVTRWVLGLGKLVFDADGNILAMMGTIQDITDRVLVKNELSQNEEKYRELFEANADSIAIFLIKENGTTSDFIDCNENNAKLLGYSKEEVFNLNPVQVEIPISQQQFLWRIEELQKNGYVDFETKLIHKTGALIDVEIKAKLIEYKHQPAIMNISRDISKRKHQEESLRQSNELNESLLQTIPFGMDIVDETGNVLFISKNLQNAISEDAVGKKCWSIYRDDKTQCSDCPLHFGIHLGETQFYESKGVFGGRTYQISHTGMIYQGKNAMLEIFTDITEKKEVQSKVNLLAHSLESISECVTITDKDDIIIYVNKSFNHTYGYDAGELIGQHTSILRSPEMRLEHVRDILPITIEGGWRGEIMNRKKDGTLFPIQLSTSIIKDDQENPIALIGVATDISEMRKSRAELIAAKDKAEESNRLKTAFLNNMSHEIRTPMNHIMGFSSLMSEAEGSEKDIYAGIILNSSNQLLALIENVILLSRLQSEKTELNEQIFNPETLISGLENRYSQDCLKKEIELQVRIPENSKNLFIVSDMEKIRQVLVNMITNAIKYTKQGFVEIGYELVENQIRFLVADSGIGIPKNEQDRIFDSFYRSEQAIEMAIGGTGLGLSIVKELVASLKGKLRVESEIGKGACFSFSIPAVQSSSSDQPEQPAKHVPRSLKEITILVADDEQINFLYLEILLKNSVKSMDYAYNGKVAVDMVSKKRYDLILMDLKMPELSGYDATRQIKLIFPNLPVIAQTAYATNEDKQMAISAGCDDFIAKPIKKNMLLELIQKYS
jgi:hypothetical protein